MTKTRFEERGDLEANGFVELAFEGVDADLVERIENGRVLSGMQRSLHEEVRDARVSTRTSWQRLLGVNEGAPVIRVPFAGHLVIGVLVAAAVHFVTGSFWATVAAFVGGVLSPKLLDLALRKPAVEGDPKQEIVVRVSTKEMSWRGRTIAPASVAIDSIVSFEARPPRIVARATSGEDRELPFAVAGANKTLAKKLTALLDEAKRLHASYRT